MAQGHRIHLWHRMNEATSSVAAPAPPSLPPQRLPSQRLSWFTSGDIDGFFGLFFSGFPDLLLIVGLAPVCGFPAEFVTGRVLPGVALSVLIGNLFYAWQAR